MHDAKLVRSRYLRLVVWALLMVGTSVEVGMCAPRRTVLVPCIFLALMVPMVLLPLKPKAKG